MTNSRAGDFVLGPCPPHLSGASRKASALSARTGHKGSDPEDLSLLRRELLVGQHSLLVELSELRELCIHVGHRRRCGRCGLLVRLLLGGSVPLGILLLLVMLDRTRHGARRADDGRGPQDRTSSSKHSMSPLVVSEDRWLLQCTAQDARTTSSIASFGIRMEAMSSPPDPSTASRNFVAHTCSNNRIAADESGARSAPRSSMSSSESNPRGSSTCGLNVWLVDSPVTDNTKPTTSPDASL